MIKTIIIDKAQNVCLAISKHFEKNNFIEIVGCFETFSNINLHEIDLIVFDITNSDFEEKIEAIENAKKENPNIEFIAISSDMDSNLLNKTLKQGVKDFLLKPIIPSILEASIKKIDFKKEEKKEISSIKKAKTISIFSLKGGVGKTSSALNLAYEFQEKTQKNVCLLDFNLTSSDCALFLNLNANTKIDELIAQFQQLSKDDALSLIAKYKESKLYVLPIKDENDFSFKLTPTKITTIINSLKNIFDYIIIDTHSAFDENNLAILSCCDLILYISLLSQTAIQNTRSMVEIFSKIGYNHNKIKLILNRYSDNTQISIEDFEREVNKEVFAKIPNNYLTLSDAINQASPLNITNPQSNIAKAYKKLVDLIENQDIQKESLTNEYNHGIYNIIHKMGE